MLMLFSKISKGKPFKKIKSHSLILTEMLLNSPERSGKFEDQMMIPFLKAFIQNVVFFPFSIYHKAMRVCGI